MLHSFIRVGDKTFLLIIFKIIEAHIYILYINYVHTIKNMLALPKIKKDSKFRLDYCLFLDMAFCLAFATVVYFTSGTKSSTRIKNGHIRVRDLYKLVVEKAMKQGQSHLRLVSARNKVSLILQRSADV